MRKTLFYVKLEKVIEFVKILSNFKISNQVTSISNENEVIFLVESFFRYRIGMDELYNVCEYSEIEDTNLGLDNIEDY